MVRSTLSPRGRALVRASRLALQPTDADRARLLHALRLRLGPLCCRPTRAWCRAQLWRAQPHRRRRAFPAGPAR